jgi:hypothetical protein
MKTCTKCNIEKPLNEFSKGKTCKDGYQYNCKQCSKNYIKQYHQNNSDYQKQYSKNYRQNTPEYQKHYYHSNQLHLKQYSKNYRQNNPEYQKQYYNSRRKIDSSFKLSDGIRSLIYNSFKGLYKKSKKTEHILGCTIEEFIQHIQTQFTEGMTLENHGQGIGKWNIDHIIPISSAKTEEEIYKLNHYTNLQPLWWEENMAKGKKIL